MQIFSQPIFPAYAKTAAVSEGRHLPDVGVQTGANASPCRPHSAALRSHVLCEKAFSGLPQEDHLAAGTVPRLPYTVGSLSSKFDLSLCKNESCHGVPTHSSP